MHSTITHSRSIRFAKTSNKKQASTHNIILCLHLVIAIIQRLVDKNNRKKRNNSRVQHTNDNVSTAKLTTEIHFSTVYTVLYSEHCILLCFVMRFCNLFFPWNQYFRSDMRWMSRSIMFAFCISFHRINCRTAILSVFSMDIGRWASITMHDTQFIAIRYDAFVYSV